MIKSGHRPEVCAAPLLETIAKRLTPAKPTPVAAEIRSYIAGLDKSERIGFIHDRVAHRDMKVCDAVLNASPYASHIDEQTHDMLRRLAEEAFAPVIVFLYGGGFKSRTI